MNRRDFLKLAGAAGLSVGVPWALARASDERFDGPYFVVFNASGGWDTEWPGGDGRIAYKDGDSAWVEVVYTGSDQTIVVGGAIIGGGSLGGAVLAGRGGAVGRGGLAAHCQRETKKQSGDRCDRLSIQKVVLLGRGTYQASLRMWSSRRHPILTRRPRRHGADFHNEGSAAWI